MRKPIKEKNINEMTREEFYEIPHRVWNEEIGLFHYLVLLPAKGPEDSEKDLVEHTVARLRGERNIHLHDSGFRFITYVAVKDNYPICQMGASDILHINGIGGYGVSRISIPRLITPIAWSIDCLPKSRLFRLFARDHDLRVGLDLSSFEVFAIKRKENEK